MVNKSIKTKEEYDLALLRIEGLMDAGALTPEADELELFMMKDPGSNRL